MSSSGAGALNARGVKTARGRQWYAGTVRLVMQRSDRIDQKGVA